MATEMTPQERAAVYKYHRVFDGYNFLSGPKGMEEIVGHDMELVSLEDHEAALQETRRAALLEASKVAMTYGEQARDEDLSGSYTSELIVKALDRLAQEGA